MSELVMTIKADQESLDMAMQELQRAIEKYPRIAETVLKDPNKYIVMSTHMPDIDECNIKMWVCDGLYRLIELVYDIKLVDVTTDDSKHREFVGVANE